MAHSILSPPGSIMPYIGKTDPDGWIICDGTLRTVTDSRFSALAIMLGGSNTANSLTPPDLRSKFLYGSSSISTTLVTGGASDVTLTIPNLPAHNHTINITENDHSHSITDKAHSHACRNGATDDFNYTGGQHPLGDGGDLNQYFNTESAYTGITSTNGAKTNITATSVNTGSGTAFSILPSHYTINYIMKY